MRKTSVLLFLLLSAFLITGVACQPEKVTYRVTFDAAGEEFLSEAQRSYFSQGITVFHDAKITIPETAGKDDQAIYNADKSKVVDFWLWKEAGKKWNFSTGVREDITLIAQWKETPTT